MPAPIIAGILSALKAILGSALKKGASKLLEKGAQTVLTKGATKIAEEGVKKGVGGLIQKGVQGAAKAVVENAANKGGSGGALSEIIQNVSVGGKEKRKAGEVIKNIAMGDLWKNKAKKSPQIAEAESSIGYPETEGPMLGKLGKMSDIISAIKPTYERGSEASPVQKTLQGSQRQNRPLFNPQGSKIADTVNNVLFGEGFGSNVLRRTMANAARQGIFSGSDVGQPDVDRWGILGNSLLGGVAGASIDQVQQQFDNRQMLSHMMNEFNPADESMKTMQPVMLDKINGFRDYIIGVGASKKGLQKGKYNSQEMLDITSRFNQLQKEIGTAIQANQQLGKDYAEFYKNTDKYDPIDFRLGSEYVLKHNRYPDKPILTPAEVDPDTFFSNLSISNKDAWKPVNEAAPYEMQSPLTQEQKRQLAGTYLYTNPGLQKHIMRKKVPEWKQQHSGDAELMRMFTNPDGSFDDMRFAEFMTAYHYGDKVEQNKVDWDAKAKYMKSRTDDAEKTAKERAAEEEKRGYYFSQSYPYDNNQSGPAIVFKKTFAENIPPSMLQDATGAKITTDDEVVPVNFEYVDGKGNLVVTASVSEAGTQRKRRLTIPPGRSRGLLESYFPGLTSDPKAQSMFNVKNETPTGVYSQDMESKIDLFMEKNGISDRDEAVKKLRELKIL